MLYGAVERIWLFASNTPGLNPGSTSYWVGACQVMVSFFFLIVIFIHLFVCARSWLQRVGSSIFIAACGI